MKKIYLLLLFIIIQFSPAVMTAAEVQPVAEKNKPEAVSASVTQNAAPMPSSDSALGMIESKGIPVASGKKALTDDLTASSLSRIPALTAELPSRASSEPERKTAPPPVTPSEKKADVPVWKEKKSNPSAPPAGQVIPPSEFQKYHIYKVWKVYDADNLRLEGDEHVALIGVDAPENFFNRKMLNEARRTNQTLKSLRVSGKIAVEHTRALTEGKYIRLEFDEKKRDDHGRLLAYVFLQDGTFLNAELIRSGYARAVESSPNSKYAKAFAGLEAEARANARGFWKAAQTPSKA